MRLLTIAIKALGVVLVLSGQSKACSCFFPTVAGAFASYDAVFSGEVVAYDVIDCPFPHCDTEVYEIIFRVSQSWKGIDDPDMTVYTPTGSSACGFNSMDVGDQFVIYVRNQYAGVDGMIFDSCSRSQRLVDGHSDDIPELDRLHVAIDFPDEAETVGPSQSGNLCGNSGFFGGLAGIMLLGLTLTRSQRSA